MSEKSFYIIGISDDSNLYFKPEIIEIIRKGKVFSGGRRHHELVKDLIPGDVEWIDVTVPLSNVFDEYSRHNEITVFASGDPLFYGFANTIMREFPDARVKVFPTFNSLQMLAHRLLLPYATMTNVSLTGRDWKELDTALLEDRKLIGVLTDKTKTPDAIAAYLLRFGFDNYSMTVGQQLGNRDEEIMEISLTEASRMKFRTPNCIILRMQKPRHRFFGIPENEFSHLFGRGNMITKMPVRLLSVSMLDLSGKSVLWDIGFCTGSVSIEAKQAFPDLTVIAFEKREESRDLLEKNMKKFGVPGIKGIIGDFMETDLSALPSPDAVFIGGHGGCLNEMIERIIHVMKPGGVIVFNSVIEDNCRIFKESIENHGMKIADKHTITIDNHNPITIMKAL